MNREPNEILSAFLDGEAVEDLELAEALAAPGGREALVDFVLLRGAVASANDRPSEGFYETMDHALEPQRPQRRWIAVTAAAAAMLVVAIAVWSWRPTDPVEIPEVSPPIPEATRTLHFQRGVDWQGQG